MKKLSKLFAILAVIGILGVMLAACARAEEPAVEEPVVEQPVVEEPVVEEPVAPTDAFTIGISNPFISSEYRTQMIDSLIATNEEYKALGLTTDLVIESFDTDVAGQIEQIENLINAGVDAMLVNPGDAVALNQILEEAVEMGIMVFSIDQEIEAEGVINVGHDQYEWARISAEWFAETLQEGNVVQIEGFIGHPANNLRMSAVADVFANYPGINVLASESGFWDEATGQQVMSDFLAAYPNLDGYWTQDGMAIGALEAVIAANPDPYPLGVGEGRVKFLQLWAEMLERDPDFETIAVANAPGVNSTALRIAVEMLLGRELDQSILGGQFGTTIVIDIPIIVTPENFAEVYEEYVASGDYPDSYLLDGIMTRNEVIAAFFN
jgi:ribose transport system substrate-binding protein